MPSSVGALTPLPEAGIFTRRDRVRRSGDAIELKHVFEYDDGEVRQEFSICMLARVTGGDLAVSEESFEVAFYRPDELADLPMVDSIRLRISDYLSGDTPVLR